MNVEDIKRGIASLSVPERGEVTAFLFHLRHASDSNYQERVASKLSDRDPRIGSHPKSSSASPVSSSLVIPPAEVYMHLGLLDSIPKSGNQRRKIMDFIYSLREHPDTREYRQGRISPRSADQGRRRLRHHVLARCSHSGSSWSWMYISRTSNRLTSRNNERCV